MDFFDIIFKSLFDYISLILMKGYFQNLLTENNNYDKFARWLIIKEEFYCCQNNFKQY